MPAVSAQIIDLIWVLASLAVILAAAELFTNAVEWLGAKLKLSEGAVGSVLAAVGTAMPETIIPIVAILLDAFAHRLHTPQSMAQNIGLGAIIGAPFMLGTLAFFVVGVTYVIARATGRRKTAFSASPDVIVHDFEFFLIAFSIGAAVGVLKHYWPAMPLALDWLLALSLIVVYFIYLRRITGEGAAVSEAELHALHLGRPLPWVDEHNPRKRFIAMQLFIAIALMFAGAHIFVQHLTSFSTALGVNPLILALLIVPVATELPEKFNSVLWVSRGKDTMALGNISGAMVFQSTFPISLGLLFLDWNFSPMHPAFLSACFGLAGALIAYVTMRITGRINPYALMFGGVLYLGYLTLVILHMSGVIHLAVDPAAMAGHGVVVPAGS